MAEQNLIDDVRRAKAWVDQQADTVEELGRRLREVERAYRDGTGDFAAVPRRWPEPVRRAIEAAADEPGREALEDSRQPRRA